MTTTNMKLIKHERYRENADMKKGRKMGKCGKVERGHEKLIGKAALAVLLRRCLVHISAILRFIVFSISLFMQMTE
jgi:hypothetical protein